MIKMVSVVCPECRANLEIDRNRKMCYCQYCGTKILIDDGSTTHTYRKVDEARIKEAEIREVIRLKELEIEEKRREASERTKRFKVFVSSILGIVGIIFFVIGFLGGEASGDPDSAIYSLAFIGFFCFFGIFFLWMNDSKKE